jgi:DNA-binding MarR family transcriptional regulator
MIDLIIRESWLAIKRNFLLELKQFKISESEAYILTIIPKEGINSTLIPSLLGLATGSASRSLSKLENKQMIEKRTDDDDKRVVKIFLTSKGLESRRIVRNVIVNYRQFLSNKIGDKNLKIAEEILSSLIESTRRGSKRAAKKRSRQ